MEEAKITIRRMTAEDIEQVLEVERASFHDPWSREVFNATLLLPYAYYYVAEVWTEDAGARIVGECGVRDIFGEGDGTKQHERQQQRDDLLHDDFSL